MFSCVQLLWPHGLQPARLLCPWNLPGKNTGMGCHFLLQGIFPTQGLNLFVWHLAPALSETLYPSATLWRNFSMSMFAWVSCSVCLTLCNPMGCGTPGFPVFHYLPELTQTHVHICIHALIGTESKLTIKLRRQGLREI